MPSSNGLKELLANTNKQSLTNFDLYNLVIRNRSILLYISHKRATKASHIHATESGDIIWEQLYPFGGLSRPSSERQYVLKPERKKDSITIVSIRGIAGSITGLDTDIFSSHLAIPKLGNIYLMSEARLEEFLEKI